MIKDSLQNKLTEWELHKTTLTCNGPKGKRRPGWSIRMLHGECMSKVGRKGYLAGLLFQ